MYTQGDGIITAIPIPHRILPSNKQKVDTKVPTKIHPKTMIGAKSKKVFLMPRNSVIFPPIGVKTIAIIMSMLTNHDSWLSSREIFSNDIVPNEAIVPNETRAKDTFMAPKTFQGVGFCKF